MDDLDSTRMPLWQHLEQLRKTLFRCLGIILVGFCVTYYFSDRIIYFLEKPLLDIFPEGQKHLYFTGIGDKFFTYLKISTYSAIALTSPLLLYQIWSFVAPALYRHEKRFFGPFIFLGTAAFVAGLVFTYTLVLPTGYKFLIEFGPKTEIPMITLVEYFSTTVQLMMALGLVFELPVALMLLAKFGIIEVKWLVKMRGHAYVLLAILAAVITPTPDAFTMLLVLVPLFLLYEVSVILVRWVTKPVVE